MNIAIVGSRDFPERLFDEYYELILHHFGDGPTTIVSGGCKTGGDKFARFVYEKLKHERIEHIINYIEFLPKWNLHGKAAGPIRNKQIVDYSDMVIAIWDGKSAGTKSTLNFAKSANIESEIYYF